MGACGDANDPAVRMATVHKLILGSPVAFRTLKAALLSSTSLTAVVRG